MAGIASVIYQSIIRRNAVFLSTIFTGAFAFEMCVSPIHPFCYPSSVLMADDWNSAFDTTSNKLWDTINRGRQWKDIKPLYLNKGDEDDEEDDE